MTIWAKRNLTEVRAVSLRRASLVRRSQVLALECSMTVTEWPGLEPALNVTAGKPGDAASSSHLLTRGVLTCLSDQDHLPRRLRNKGLKRHRAMGPAGTPNSRQSRLFILTMAHAPEMLPLSFPNYFKNPVKWCYGVNCVPQRDRVKP